jgi:hypothetical protein
MAKLEPFSFGNISPELEAFRDSLTAKWNYGKYAIPLITSAPNWASQPGETVLFTPNSGGTTMYFYKNSAWVSSWSVTV